MAGNLPEQPGYSFPILLQLNNSRLEVIGCDIADRLCWAAGGVADVAEETGREGDLSDAEGIGAEAAP